MSIVATAAPEIPVLGRDEAFEYLYRRYVKDVYHYALALLRNPADAEDVTQTTFLNAYRAYQRGIEVQKPQNWLIKIAHNVARTRYARAGRRVKEVPLDDHVEQLALPEADRPDVTGVLHALGRLPFNQRAALVMRELEGRSYAEIADTIGVSVSAVETLIFRGRKSLRLKASALRALVAVPLPGSLTQLFEGNGAVVGGGAAIGTGFLVKAAVAVVAGVVATGMGAAGDHSRTAAAPAPRLGSVQAPHRADGLMTRPLSFLLGATRGRTAVADDVLGKPTAVHTGRNEADRLGAYAGVPRRPRTEPAASPTEGPSVTPAVPSSPSSPFSPSSPNVPNPATSPVSSAAGTVETVVPAVTAPLPVQVSSLPPVPVDVPQVPPGIPLP
jgi:RNA polymerase sigma factor (sigma-70 family)